MFLVVNGSGIVIFDFDLDGFFDVYFVNGLVFDLVVKMFLVDVGGLVGDLVIVDFKMYVI